MLGGMSGGGMGFIFAPERKAEGQQFLQKLMSETKRALASALPFAMEPVVYDFAINERGTWADLLTGADALMPPGYYRFIVPRCCAWTARNSGACRLAELDRFAAPPAASAARAPAWWRRSSIDFPAHRRRLRHRESLDELLAKYGFDRAMHEQIREDLKAGRIGLAQNRLPANSTIEDVPECDLTDTAALAAGASRNRSRRAAKRRGGGGHAGRRRRLRWTQGAGVVKALHPFCKLGGRHRSFVETHLAKSRKIGSAVRHSPAPHFHHQLLLARADQPLSRTTRSLRLRGAAAAIRGQIHRPAHRADRARPALRLGGNAAADARRPAAEGPRQPARRAHRLGAERAGEASDYTDNLPQQCLHPVGHWYEVPNLLRNGTLAELLAERPQLKTLVLHNIDTVGMNVDPALLGHHLASGAGLTFEVITRRLEDRGGGLARVNGRPRLVEGLAMPREEDEFHLTYYNSNTCWIDIDALLAASTSPAPT
jgi:hypothetical protein